MIKNEENRFNIQEYLRRIHVTKQITPNEESLNELIFAHQCYIPYENIDVYSGRAEISLEVNHLFQKLVVRNRGGYCFELNGLFHYLLIGLEFRTYPCFCRVQKGALNPNPIRHQGNIVLLNGEHWYTDVGYGTALCPGSLKIKEGIRQRLRNDIYWFEKYNDFWYRLMHIPEDLILEDGSILKGQEQCELLISIAAVEPFDFETYNEITSKSPDSPFKRHRRAHLLTKEGSIAFMDQEFSEQKNGYKVIQMIQDEEEEKNILKDRFGIEI